jgi:hypothetical protein
MYSPLWTLVSMVCRPISPLLTLQHLPSSSMPAWSLWSSMIQRLTDSTTQQWHNTHLLFYTSTLMRFKISSCILFREYRHPWRYKRFLQQIHKREIWKFLSFLLLLCLSLSNSSPPSFYSRSSTIHQTQRKISSMTKLPSTELFFFFPPLHTILS